jgi:hypothetical protein
MTNTKWLEIENTSILMLEEEVGCLKEWQPFAQVTLRQVYPTVEPLWYVISLNPFSDDAACKFATKQEACAYALSQVI